MSTYIAVHFHSTSAISLCHQPWDLENKSELTLLEHLLSVFFTPIEDEDEDENVTGSLSLRLGFECVFSPLSMNEKRLACLFANFVSHALAFISTMLPKSQARKPTSPSESRSKPSTNLAEIVKRKSNHAWELKECVYFVVIQAPRFIDWTFSACQRGAGGHG